MDVTHLPFNRLIGVESFFNQDAGFQIGLANDQKYTNHLGTVHASAMLSVAEAGSGDFLAKTFSEFVGFVPVVRRLDAKFRKPGTGQIVARCTAAPDQIVQWKDALGTRSRALVALPIEVIDATGNVVMQATVEWFIAKGA